MATHAVCSSSASKMWINCPPSARLQLKFPAETSSYAEEGTWVHSLCEYKVKRHLKKRVSRPQSEEYDSEEAERNSDLYLETIIGIEEAMRKEHGSVIVMVEERLDFSSVVPEGFGTGDCVLVSPGEIHICDYKNGRGVFVDADHNSQMMLYAIGAVNAYDLFFDIQTVSMTVIQPNLENISTFSCSKEELLAWGESIKPIAQLAFEGGGEQKCGDWCRFCRARPQCAARKREALALVQEEFLDLDAEQAALAETTDATAPYSPNSDAPTFRQPGLVPREEIERILPTLNRIADWIDAVFAYVTSEAIHHGVTWKGYKVVEGRSKRQFSDPAAVVRTAQDEGYTDIYKRELLSLSEFEKMMGKKNFNRILGKFVVKPAGKLTLVPDSDPRPAVELNAEPGDDFDVLDESCLPF